MLCIDLLGEPMRRHFEPVSANQKGTYNIQDVIKGGYKGRDIWRDTGHDTWRDTWLDPGGRIGRDAVIDICFLVHLFIAKKTRSITEDNLFVNYQGLKMIW